MEHYNQKIGLLGEKIAEKYLRALGYMVYKNVRHGTKQIDIVACKTNEMRIIEVKTIFKDSYKEKYLTLAKKHALKTSYNIFDLILAKNKEYLYADLIIIYIIDKKMANIKYYKNII